MFTGELFERIHLTTLIICPPKRGQWKQTNKQTNPLTFSANCRARLCSSVGSAPRCITTVWVGSSQEAWEEQKQQKASSPQVLETTASSVIWEIICVWSFTLNKDLQLIQMSRSVRTCNSSLMIILLMVLWTTESGNSNMSANVCRLKRNDTMHSTMFYFALWLTDHCVAGSRSLWCGTICVNFN